MTDNQRAYERAITELAGVSDIGEVSDGFHTFNQLYHQRAMLFAVIVKMFKHRAWKTWRHEDGEPCFGGGWFLVTIDTPSGAYGYHYEEKYWDLFDCAELETAKPFDGYTEDDVDRLFSFWKGELIVSEQEHIDIQTRYQKQMENEKKLYDKLVNWRKSLSDLEYSVSLNNPGHYPNPAKDIQVLQYTTTADYVLNGVIRMCQDLLDIDSSQPTEVVESESDPS